MDANTDADAGYHGCELFDFIRGGRFPLSIAGSEEGGLYDCE